MIVVKSMNLKRAKQASMMNREDSIKALTEMTFDVNPAEIAHHIEHGNLKDWCLQWRTKMNMLIIQIQYEDKEKQNER